MSVTLFIRMEQLGSYWADFYEILYSTIFRKYAEKIEVWLQSDKNNWYSISIHMYIYGNIFIIFS
jgi:hypothetical protein